MTAVSPLREQSVRFAMFDWLDESGRGQAETYEERLRMLELADQSGFYCYHLAEHHATELSTVPSPNLFLAAVAQRTRRIRLGALSYVMPLYEPIRLLEEICMLDQLSGVRLELGLGRGSTGELIDDDPDKARAMFHEVLDIVRVPGVSDVHDLQVWSIAGCMNSPSAHLQVAGDCALGECDALLGQLNRVLASRYRILHTTIQFECANCDPRQSDLYCSISDDRAGERRHAHEPSKDGVDVAKRGAG